MVFHGDGGINKKYVALLIETLGLSNALNCFSNILNAVWDNVFTNPKFESYINRRIRTCPGVISSLDTLLGIRKLCEIEDYIDAFLLIRKLRDNLFLDLFLFEAQKNFEKIAIDGIDTIDFASAEEAIRALEKLNLECINMESSKAELKAITQWRDGAFLMSNDRTKRKYFGFDNYLKYLINNNLVFGDCYEKYLKDRCSTLGQELNDYVHSNGGTTLIKKQNPHNILCKIKDMLIDVERLFLIGLYFVDPILLLSDDYMDCKESGMVPPEGSQYWVNGYIKKAFQNIKSSNEDLFNYLLSHNEYMIDIDIL